MKILKLLNPLKTFSCSVFIILLVSNMLMSGQTAGQEVLKREFKIKKGQTYLNLPVNNSDQLVRATIRMDGKALDRFTINLATVTLNSGHFLMSQLIKAKH